MITISALIYKKTANSLGGFFAQHRLLFRDTMYIEDNLKYMDYKCESSTVPVFASH